MMKKRFLKRGVLFVLVVLLFASGSSFASSSEYNLTVGEYYNKYHMGRQGLQEGSYSGIGSKDGEKFELHLIAYEEKTGFFTGILNYEKDGMMYGDAYFITWVRRNKEMMTLLQLSKTTEVYDHINAPYDASPEGFLNLVETTNSGSLDFILEIVPTNKSNKLKQSIKFEYAKQLKVLFNPATGLYKINKSKNGIDEVSLGSGRGDVDFIAEIKLNSLGLFGTFSVREDLPGLFSFRKQYTGQRYEIRETAEISFVAYFIEETPGNPILKLFIGNKSVIQGADNLTNSNCLEMKYMEEGERVEGGFQD